MRKLIHFIVIPFIFLLTSSVCADLLEYEQSQLSTTQHQLIIDQKSLQLAQNRFEQFQKGHSQLLSYYQEHGVTKSTTKHAEIDVMSVKTSLAGVAMALDAARDQRNRVRESIADLNKEQTRLVLLKGDEPRLKFAQSEVSRKLDIENALLSVQQTRIRVLTDTGNVLQAHLQATTQWLSELQDLQLIQRHAESVLQSTEEMKALQTRLDQWIVTLSDLNKQIQAVTQKGQSAESEIQALNLKIIEANENVELTRLDVYLLTLQNDIRSAADSVKQNLSVSNLNSMSSLTQRTLKEVKDASGFVQSKVEYLDLKKGEFQSNSYSGDSIQMIDAINKLQESYQAETLRLEEMNTKLEKVQLQINKLLAQQVAQRQELPGLDLEGWVTLAVKAFQIPLISYQFIKTCIKQSYHYFSSQSSTMQYVYILSAFMIGFLWLALRIVLRYLAAHLIESRERFSVNIMYTMIELFKRNLTFWTLLGTLIALSLITRADFSLLIYCTLTFIIFRSLMGAARITLLESISDVDGEDVKLYYQLKWALMLGAVLTLAVVTSHVLPIAYEVRVLVNRVFMVFVLLVGVLFLHGRHLLPKLLDSTLILRRRYVYHALRILNILVPVGLIFNAVIGLFGYVDLAWTIAKMQGIFLLVLAAYLVFRGLVIDLLDYASENIIKYSSSGWVWTEAFLKPADKIMRLITLFLAVFALLHLYSLDQNVYFVTTASLILNKKLFSLGSNDITPFFIMKFVVFVAVVYWSARWSREFSVRWWYTRFKDLGLRNSLSIFTQYAVVITGVLIGLQIIGLDLSGLAVVAAAFFAGIGFGLRDMANNYFSGLLMLMERPFRRGDIIRLGEFEGEIVHQGMRSTTVRTWEHMDVIVPNSEMFTKPFVNWTHQDNIVRSTITLNINRQDNPRLVQNLVCDVLANYPEVLVKPEPHVLMKEISDSLVQMEVRYFIEVSEECSRIVVRSQILFAIWDMFKAHGIKAPFPQYDVQLTNTALEREREEK